MRMDEHDALAAPRVASTAYDTDYFLHRCGGAERWRAGEQDPLYDGSLTLAGLRRGESVLDIGTGRGELLVAACQRGAVRAVGVEYSAAAVALAGETLRRAGLDGDHARVHLADARALPVDPASFDLITMLDVVEHLEADELARALREARRALRPGGRIFIHTFPTRTLYELTYRLQRLARPGRRAKWPRDPRNDLERTMHVGEQTLRSLRRALRRAGFVDVRVTPGAWMHTSFVPDERARRLYHQLARVPPLRRFAVADLWAHGRRPA